MNNDILLKEAKLKYPIGAKFRSAWSDAIGTISDTFKVNSSGDIVNNTIVLYDASKDRWGELLRVPEVEINNLYTIY